MRRFRRSIQRARRRLLRASLTLLFPAALSAAACSPCTIGSTTHVTNSCTFLGVPLTQECALSFDSTNPTGQATNRIFYEYVYPTALAPHSKSPMGIVPQGVGWTFTGTSTIATNGQYLAATKGITVATMNPTSFAAYGVGTSVTAGTSTAISITSFPASGTNSYWPNYSTCTANCTYSGNYQIIVEPNTVRQEACTVTGQSGTGNLTLAITCGGAGGTWQFSHTTPNVMIPQFTYPAQEADFNAAMAFLGATAGVTLPGDPNQTILFGVSSGEDDAQNVVSFMNSTKTKFLNNASCPSYSWFGATYGASCASANTSTNWTIIGISAYSVPVNFAYGCDHGVSCNNFTAKLGCNPSTSGGDAGCQTFSNTVDPNSHAAALGALNIPILIQGGASDTTAVPGMFTAWQSALNATGSNYLNWPSPANHGFTPGGCFYNSTGTLTSTISQPFCFPVQMTPLAPGAGTAMSNLGGFR